LSTFRSAQGYARKRPSCFTDKGSIFIDVSVNGRAFAKCSPDKSARQALSQIYRQTIFAYFHHSMRIVMHTQKNRIRFAIDGKPSGFLI